MEKITYLFFFFVKIIWLRSVLSILDGLVLRMQAWSRFWIILWFFYTFSSFFPIARRYWWFGNLWFEHVCNPLGGRFFRFGQCRSWMGVFGRNSSRLCGRCLLFGIQVVSASSNFCHGCNMGNILDCIDIGVHMLKNMFLTFKSSL